ncbi:zinc finger matrin-type protein 4-like isoform X1 [Montipora capricornis]|uniref:zinc finger matrin-type protein 4-like isoform X1 n=1 Tax=Montipora capricornis TaxID=246305 RepID=UPI0035F1FF43
MATYQSETSPGQLASFSENNNPFSVTDAEVMQPNSHSMQATNNTRPLSTGSKRKISENQQQNDSCCAPFKQSAQQLFCEICNVLLNSLSQAAQHKRGKSHQINAMKGDMLNSQKDLTQENAGSSPTGVNKSDLSCIILGDFIEGKTDVNLECMICNKIFNSIIQAGQHYNGQSHKRKLQSVIASNMMSASSLHDVCISSTQQQNASSTTNQLPEGESLLLKADGNNSEVPLLSTNKGMNELYCEFCGLEANSKLQMEMHLRGAKHKNAVTRSAMSTACGGSEKAVISCVDCHMNFNSQCQLEQHSASQKHQNRVNQQQRYQTVGQCRGRRRMPMGHGRGQQRGMQASSGGFSNRGRGRPLAMYPAISTSFVPSRNNQAYPFNPPSQPTNYSLKIRQWVEPP